MKPFIIRLISIFILLLFLVSCSSDDIKWFKTKEKAIEFGMQFEIIDEIFAIEEVEGETIVIYEHNGAMGVASIAEGKKGYGWYRISPYLDLSKAEGNKSIFIKPLDVKTKTDLYFTIVVGKVYDPLAENVIVHGDGEDKILQITNNHRLFYYIPTAPISDLSLNFSTK